MKSRFMLMALPLLALRPAPGAAQRLPEYPQPARGIPAAEVTRQDPEAPQGRVMRAALTGAGIGLLVGLVVGALTAEDCPSTGLNFQICFDPAAHAIMGGAVGALLGGTIGAIVGATRGSGGEQRIHAGVRVPVNLR